MISLQSCCEDGPAVGLVEGLSWAADSTMTWASNGAPRYDRVRGDLDDLLARGGDYGPTVLDCQNDVTATSSQEGSVPPAGNASYFLVRADGACSAGSYDSGGPAQQGSRDAGVNSSPSSCP